MKQVAEGFTILKRYGRLKTACWILENNGEAAIVEMPPYSRGEKAPWEKAKTYFKKNWVFPKYGLLTHPHWDHCYTMPHFRAAFPQTRFVAHDSFLHDSYFRYMMRNMRNTRGESLEAAGYRFFDDVFTGDIWAGDLGGEPLYIIYAPKHSYGDMLIIFKGAMITGDWYLGDLKDCNDLVNPHHKVLNIDKTMRIVNHLNYHIHMLFSGHGDALFYDADFYSIMEQSKVDHNGHQPALKARYQTA
ncbi:MAG: MBL fold metallo-hydrolase [Firmicutes bacterium]|nr:MBL fold metallo-hydrolase [Bacillota bacterium]